jgi:hypothetical protein
LTQAPVSERSTPFCGAFYTLQRAINRMRTAMAAAVKALK